MKNQLFKLLGFCLFISASLYAQDGTVSGTLISEMDGLPLPGVSIIVKGTTRGVQTDFDGNYAIKCSVGETLVFSYVGSKTREVRVTSRMIGIDANDFFVEKIPIQILENDAYKDAIKNNPKVDFSTPSIEESERTYNKSGRYQYNRIQQIDIEKDKVNLTYFKPDIYFEIGFNQTFSTQFFKEQNLPKLQSTYAQGASQNGELTFLGADTGTLFSYGPKLTDLEFDGSNYLYDRNGQLVPLGNGNGNLPIVYDNTVLNTSIKSSNHLFFNVSTDHALIGLDYTHSSSKDVFNREKNKSNDIIIAFKNKRDHYKNLTWNTFLKYGNSVDNQPNINGFINNVLLNAWSTPTSFSNSQGFTLENNSQRRFNSNFNNPNWLLENNRNFEKNSFFIASVQNAYRISEEIELNSNLSYTNNKDTQNFGLVKNTAGFEEGYLSNKAIEKDVFNALVRFEYDNNDYSESNIEIASVFDFSSEELDYTLNEATGFNDFSFSNPENNFRNSNRLNRNTLRLNNKFSYKYLDAGLEMTVGNNSYISSLQNNKWFLPLLQLKVDFNDLLNTYLFNGFYFTATSTYNINDASLFYNNQSHNSLDLLPSQSLSYTSNNDLFLSNSVALEDNTNQELALTLQFHLLRANFDFEINYFNTETKGSVFPVFENNAFQLKNIAAIRNRGIELGLSSNFELANRLYYNPSVVFSTNRTKVLNLHTNTQRVPIAGFSSVSKNLIVGQPAGMIVGSAYERDNQNNLIIDTNGFPLVANQAQIIGDPTPDFNLGLSNSFTFADLTLDIVLDIQKGGDTWNGTQNVLNYLGRSQESVNQRNTSGFIFQGVDQQGNLNTIPVDFYNPANDISQNRYVRYGFSGVDEDAIEDGSYINLKSIDLSYLLKLDQKKPSFIREIKLSAYAHNLFTWTKFDGASPYRSLYDTASGQSLNFFNMPITTEVGFKMNIKI